MQTTIPARFLPAYRTIQNLAQDERCLGAFIFGSLARGEATEQSDCDVKVIVREDNPCKNINHPFLAGVKLDITFNSFQQIRVATEQEIARRERVPMIAESLIVFDKTGELQQLQQQARQIRPREVPASEYQFIQFMIYHANNKVERNLTADSATALLAMHIGVNDLLHYHYQLQQRWWVSNKRLLADLREWDAPLATLLEQFLFTCEVSTKFSLWSAIIDHILQPLGGRQPIAENNCTCERCKQDLALLLKVAEDISL